MGAESGTPGTALIEAQPSRLWEEPWVFDFFQAVRRLTQIFPERALVGRFVPPETEFVRFCAHPSFSFPASAIQALEVGPDQRLRMQVNFIGLIGPLAVLPDPYTELVMERVRARDTALRDFLDMFHHRMISLFYQAWEKYRFPVPYERGEPVRFSHLLLDLIGLGTPGLQGRQSVPDDSLIYFSGLMSKHPRCAAGLSGVLREFFEVPVEIEQFVGAWYRLDAANQTRFQDIEADTDCLGLGTVVGDEIWDIQSAARIQLGPLTLEQYRDFLPGGSAYEPLRAIARFYSGDEIDYEIQLILARDEVPRCELGSESDAAPRLGWITWMRTVPMNRDPNETILPMRLEPGR